MRNESSNNKIEGSRKIGDENLLICQRRNRSREKKSLNRLWMNRILEAQRSFVETLK